LDLTVRMLQSYVKTILFLYHMYPSDLFLLMYYMDCQGSDPLDFTFFLTTSFLFFLALVIFGQTAPFVDHWVTMCGDASPSFTLPLATGTQWKYCEKKRIPTIRAPEGCLLLQIPDSPCPISRFSGHLWRKEAEMNLQLVGNQVRHSHTLATCNDATCALTQTAWSFHCEWFCFCPVLLLPFQRNWQYDRYWNIKNIR